MQALFAVRVVAPTPHCPVTFLGVSVVACDRLIGYIPMQGLLTRNSLQNATGTTELADHAACGSKN